MTAPFPAPRGSSAADTLRRDGFLVLRKAASAAAVQQLDEELQPRFARTPFSHGLFSGSHTKRFHGLLKRCEQASALVLDEAILAVAEDILLPFCDALQLNLTQAIEIHPGELAQVPHRDQDMWHGEKGRTEYLLNVMWPLTPFTPDNGGTRLWPDSHRWQEARALPAEDAVSPPLDPGDALLFLGSTLHCAGANRTALPRRGIVVSYCLGWLKPYENMWLTYPPEVARRFPPALRDLVGYRRHRPNLGNYDGQCPSVLFGDLGEEPLGTCDDLTPAQEAAIAEHLARQRAAERTKNAAAG